METNVQAAEDAAKRAAFVAGLHEFANWLEERPWAPIMRQSGYQQDANLQIDLYGSEGLAEVRAIAERLGVKTRESMDDRTSADMHVGSVSYCVIAWHPGGRPDERDAELERLRAENAELRAATVRPTQADIDTAKFAGGWTAAAAQAYENDDESGLGYSREADDPTPISPARVPLHTGAVVDGGQLVDETDAPASGLTPAADQSRGVLAGTTPVVTYFSFGHGQTDPRTGEKLLDHYATVVAPTYEECREAMLASRFGRAWSFDYLAGTARATEWIPRWTEHEVIVAPGTDPVLAESALKAAREVLTGPPTHLEIAGAKTSCGLAIIDLDAGVGWTNDHAAVTCKACIDGMPF